jgi:hypothetical protein
MKGGGPAPWEGRCGSSEGHQAGKGMEQAHRTRPMAAAGGLCPVYVSAAHLYCALLCRECLLCGCQAGLM